MINVPARGIGKGVMDALEALIDSPTTGDLDRLAAARGRPRARRRRPTRCGRGSSAASTTRALHRAAPRRRWRLPRPHRRASPDGRAHETGVDRHRQDARSQRLPAGSARRAQRGGGGAHREPAGARLGRARVREPRAEPVAAAASSIACRCSRRWTRSRARRTRASG